MAMQVGAAQEGEPLSEINTTPLIDVMLVLLIMIIVTLPPQRHAVKLDTPLPPPPDAPPPPDDLPDPVRIMVDFDGSILWNGQVVNRNQLDANLKIEAARAVQPEIHIEPHRLAKYGVVAHVMASAQRNRLTKMGVIGGT
ncbi:MAG TPA: biopolymer transporter ExbD [Hyphomonadaceae bacterium]|jgi:biopolymer transport protein ExbD|nr:biopolymer transporter ExbD [Hyphomonadaceae bacterium]HPN07061.1 biopolymer transporter ExbD [Hyphomonadaceae bacterium]